MRKIDIYAEIYPNVGLGNINLRQNIRELDNIISDSFFKNLETRTKKVYPFYFMKGPYSACYKFEDDIVEIEIDVRNGKISRISAFKGYVAKLFGKIHPGMKFKEAFELVPALYYDEAEEDVFCKGVGGLALNVPTIDPLPEEVPELEILSISVFPSEVLTAKGSTGEW